MGSGTVTKKRVYAAGIKKKKKGHEKNNPSHAERQDRNSPWNIMHVGGRGKNGYRFVISHGEMHFCTPL